MAMRLKTAIDKFLGWCEAARKPRTAEYYRRILTGFLKNARNKPIDKLVPYDLEIWGNTWHRIQAVQRLFQWLRDSLRVIQENVFAEVRRPVARERTRILSRKEQAIYLRRCGPEYRRFLIAMRGTFARPQEVRALTWPMLRAPLDWRGTIEEALADGKALFVLHEGFKARERMAEPNKPRIIVIDRRVGRLLLRLRAKAKSLDGVIFLNSMGSPWTPNATRCQMRRLRVHFNEPHSSGEKIVTYSMRHTALTYASLKVPQKVVAELGGHRNVSTTERYQHIQTDHLHEAIEKIEDVPGKQAERERRKKAAEERKKKAG